MNTIYVYNEDLTCQIPVSGTIEVLEMTEENLTNIGWLDSNITPSGDFIKLIDDLNRMAPVELRHGPQFWDQGVDGLCLYNRFKED